VKSGSVVSITSNLIGSESKGTSLLGTANSLGFRFRRRGLHCKRNESALLSKMKDGKRHLALGKRSFITGRKKAIRLQLEKEIN
jgi:hypothetical protein